MLNKIALFLIYLRWKIFSSHTWILRDFLYPEPVCTHFPHCSQYGKMCFERYDFLSALKFTMERVMNCKPSTSIKYDPPYYKVVFFSSAGIGIEFLKKLLSDPRFELEGVVTMPDAPSGRWQKLKENIIANFITSRWEILSKYEDDLNEILEVLYEGKKIKIFKPKKIKNNQKFYQELKNLNPDYFVVISYGKILPKEILEIPRFGPINLHWSILPKYRWASPIQSVFLNKEKETGISLMYMNEKMDEGDIIKILKFPITKKDNAQTVIEKFNKLWPDFMADALWDFAKWKLTRKVQDHSQATYCRKFTKEDGKIDFLTENAQDIYAKFQAFYLWPGIYTYWNGKLVKFTDIDYGLDQTLPAGKIVFEKWVLKIWTPQGVVIVKKLKPEWKKELTAQEFYNGFKNLLW